MLVKSSMNSNPSNGCMDTDILVKPLIEGYLEDYVLYDLENSFLDCKHCVVKHCANLKLTNSNQLPMNRYKRNGDSDYSDAEETVSGAARISSCPAHSVSHDVINLCNDEEVQTGGGTADQSPLTDSKCSKSGSFDRLSLRINEINSVHLGSTSSNENNFIEVRAWTRKTLTQSGTQRSLQGYKLVTISPKGDKPEITMIIDLHNAKISVNSRYFVIGGQKVENANMQLNDPSGMVKCRQQSSSSSFKNMPKALPGQKTLNCFVKTNLQKYPEGLGLIDTTNYENWKNPEDTLTKLKFERNAPLIIDKQVESFLRNTLVDFVAYTGFAQYEKCSVFDKLVPQWSNPPRRYVLREVNLQEHDLSLNHCGANPISLTPEYFKLGKITPGKKNDCTAPRFHLENNLDPSLIPLNSAPEDDEMVLSGDGDSQEYCSTISKSKAGLVTNSFFSLSFS